MITLDFITDLFCQVDDQLPGIPKHPHATLWPSEIVTLGGEGLLHAGNSTRMNYGTGPEGFKMLREPVAQVLASPASSAFSIRVSRVLKD